MSFDKETRNLLARIITACRRRLVADVTDQLRGVFGLHPDDVTLPVEKLTHLSPHQNTAARGLRDLLDHYTVSAVAKDSDRRKAAYDRMVLEISFTILNRLAALRLCEERGLLVECVRKGTTSAGFQLFERLSCGALGGRYDAYRVFLESLFDELSIDLGVLFDRMTPQSAVFPTERCLQDVLDELNNAEIIHIWTEDETIGWIYQYFNPREERKAMRVSQAPRNSRELAVRNQFFTPRYVVEFLTDNTLGRIWYEMRQGQTSLTKKCGLMVRLPKEVFLNSVDNFHFNSITGINAAYEGDFSNLPSPKDVTWDDLQKLALAINGYDLAPSLGFSDCGQLANERLRDFERTGEWYGDAAELWCCLFFEQRRWRHFHDVPEGKDFEAIRALYATLKDRLQTDATGFSQQEHFNFPKFIIYRPKKDPRDIKLLDPACGSGHFLLYSFDLLEHIYEEAWQDPGIPKSEVTGRTLREDFCSLDVIRRMSPRLIIEHNLHGIDIDPRAVQIAALAVWLRAQKTWKGLKIRASDRPRISESNIVTATPMPGEKNMRREFCSTLKPTLLGQLVNMVFEKMKLAGEAGSLLKIEEEIKDAVAEARKQWLEGPKPEQALLFQSMVDPKSEQFPLFDMMGITDQGFWTQAEDRILAALKNYAERVEKEHGTRHRLFAEDAAGGFAFIDLCRKRYDVALMNPPFGLSPRTIFDIHRKTYADSYVELYAQMVTRGMELLNSKGRLGAISSRSFMTISRLRQYRKKVILPGISLLADLGASVMDSAFVESAAYIVSKSCDGDILAIDLRGFIGSDSKLMETVVDLASGNRPGGWSLAKRQLIAELPNGKLLYSLPVRVHNLLGHERVLEPDIATARQGMGTFNDFRFLRLRQEVPICEIHRDGWEPLAKGGPFSFYYSDIHLLLNWKDNGAELSAVNIIHNGQDAQVRQASEYWRKAGVTYSKRSQKGFSARALPAGCIIAGKGPAILSQSNISAIYLLGWINSRFIRWMIQIQANDHEFNTGILKKLPWVDIHSRNSELIERTLNALQSLQMAQAMNETNSCFFPSFSYDSFKGLLNRWNDIDRDAQTTLSSVMADWDVFVDRLYGVNSETLSFDNGDADVTEQEQTETSDEQEEESLIAGNASAGNVIGVMIGIIFGRWDVRIASNHTLTPKLPDPFEPLPVCPPGMLIGPDGMPAHPNCIASEEWLRTRAEVSSLPPAGWVKKPFVLDADYPIRISWDGILVDDDGLNGGGPHRDDMTGRIQEVLKVVWKDKAYEFEQEATEILGVTDLCDYLRKPSGFFQDHLKCYSKSRRKAPIYWPLSTASGSYTVWLYYHRLSDQTLYWAVNKYVEPKIAEIERGVVRIEDELESISGREAVKLTDQLHKIRSFLGELRDLREELLRIAGLPFKPNLDDGVIINAAPFHRLFRLRSWAKDTQDCWRKLEKGEYDWAHLAYAIWPDRVREACKRDRSIAIAHGLEDLCEVGAPVSGRKTTRGRRKNDVH